MPERERSSDDFIDLRYVKSLYHILWRLGDLGAWLDEVGMPPESSPYSSVLRETKNLVAEIEDLVKAGAFPDLKEMPGSERRRK